MRTVVIKSTWLTAVVRSAGLYRPRPGDLQPESAAEQQAGILLVESGESVRVLRNGKPIADIAPVLADLPSWKRRKVQPLVLDGVSVSRMILEERQVGGGGRPDARFFLHTQGQRPVLRRGDSYSRRGPASGRH